MATHRRRDRRDQAVGRIRTDPLRKAIQTGNFDEHDRGGPAVAADPRSLFGEPLRPRRREFESCRRVRRRGPGAIEHRRPGRLEPRPRPRRIRRRSELRRELPTRPAGHRPTWTDPCHRRASRLHPDAVSVAPRADPRSDDQPDRQHDICDDRRCEHGYDRLLRGQDDGSETIVPDDPLTIRGARLPDDCPGASWD